MYDDYLEPDQGNAGNLVAGAAMLALMYTPLGKGIFKGIGGAAKGAWKGAKWGIPKIAKFAAKRGGPRVMSTLAKSVGGTGRAMRYLGKPITWASNNTAAAVGVGLGAAAIMGGARGMRARQPYGESTTESIMFDPSMKRALSPEHNGATGDLTLALHGRR